MDEFRKLLVEINNIKIENNGAYLDKICHIE